MASLELRELTLQRIKELWRPTEDANAEAVIIRALDALEASLTNTPSKTPGLHFDITIDPRNVPNLTHTKVLTAVLDAKTYPKPNWNSLLDEVLVRAAEKELKAKDVQRICAINVKDGKKTDEGYRFLGLVNLSVQGQDANAACRGIIAMAKYLGLTVLVEFKWREKDGAAHPGKIAKLEL